MYILTQNSKERGLVTSYTKHATSQFISVGFNMSHTATSTSCNCGNKIKMQPSKYQSSDTNFSIIVKYYIFKHVIKLSIIKAKDTQCEWRNWFCNFVCGFIVSYKQHF